MRCIDESAVPCRGDVSYDLTIVLQDRALGGGSVILVKAGHQWGNTK